MTELRKLLIDKYPSFDITSQHLGKVLRDNNKTRKIMRLKTELYPEQQRQIKDELINVLNLKKDNSLIHPLRFNM
jgi:hypothetical protein